MTETPVPDSPTAPVFPPGRYGRRRTPRRSRPWLPVLLVLALVAALALVSLRLYRLYGDPQYDAEVVSYTEITEQQVVIDFQVTVPAGGSAVCLLRARSRDGAVVGRAEVPVQAAPGQRRVHTRHTLPTTARPFIGEVLRCRPAD